MKRLAIFTLALMISTGAIFAQRGLGPCATGQPGPGRMLFFDKLELTDAQQSEFDLKHLEHREKMLKFQNQLELARLEMAKVMTADGVDEGKLKELTDEISSIHAEMKQAKLALWTDIYNMLDANQKKEWKKGYGGFMGGKGRKGNFGPGRRGGRGQGMGLGPCNRF